ncbi:DNA translocase FtsK [Brevibacillus fluminis]|uniref:DNA translocase FtsK n=1 Tax=Brevibacillus fluminis TaxID=511487 RepID=A0A3M8DH32_9BACL|nr:DNA translocase FtsK [Brevibacillus fluminis]RNB87402.1 DNA translocase FtsK [Brevibacillus fluminis]
MWTWLKNLLNSMRGEEWEDEQQEMQVRTQQPVQHTQNVQNLRVQAKSKSIYPKERQGSAQSESRLPEKQRQFRFPVIPDAKKESRMAADVTASQEKEDSFGGRERSRPVEKEGQTDHQRRVSERTNAGDRQRTAEREAARERQRKHEPTSPFEQQRMLQQQKREAEQVAEQLTSPQVFAQSRNQSEAKKPYKPTEIFSPIYGKVDPRPPKKRTPDETQRRQEREEAQRREEKPLQPIWPIKKSSEKIEEQTDARKDEAVAAVQSGVGQFENNGEQTDGHAMQQVNAGHMIEAHSPDMQEGPSVAFASETEKSPVLEHEELQKLTHLETELLVDSAVDRQPMVQAGNTEDEETEASQLVQPLVETDTHGASTQPNQQTDGLEHGRLQPPEPLQIHIGKLFESEPLAAHEGEQPAEDELNQPAELARLEAGTEELTVEAVSESKVGVEEDAAIIRQAIDEVAAVRLESIDGEQVTAGVESASLPFEPLMTEVAGHDELVKEAPSSEVASELPDEITEENPQSAFTEPHPYNAMKEIETPEQQKEHGEESYSTSPALHQQAAAEATQLAEQAATVQPFPVLSADHQDAAMQEVSPVIPVVAAESTEADAPKPTYHPPQLDLLIPSPEATEDDLEYTLEQKLLLEETLGNFNVNANVVGIVKGPSVTRFELQPAPGVKVNKITGLSDDIKLNLSAKDIRIEAPIPGRNAVGIEVPNQKSEPVFISRIIGSEKFRNHPSPLAIALGMDIGGEPIVADIKKMPHGLIAGSTGSGKSVCINSIIVSLLFKASPEQVRLLLIDPKMVELAPYNHLPHLITPVVTEAKQATASLKWAVEEMERRYTAFVEAGVRDIERYNTTTDEPLPYIVIIIDELADLMMVSPQDVEDCIIRIAQKARACGIHLLLATQRPSVDVITGNIKANVPTRLAFAVFSQIDSRTILDQSGAERLLGRGDMLFLESGTTPVRLQGNFVSDDEIEQVTQMIKKQRKPNYFFSKEDLEQQVQSFDAGDDPLYLEALLFVADQGQASASALQRRFRVGYNRAARLIEMMEAEGHVAGQSGGKPRAVLITREDAQALTEGTSLL